MGGATCTPAMTDRSVEIRGLAMACHGQWRAQAHATHVPSMIPRSRYMRTIPRLFAVTATLSRELAISACTAIGG